MAKLGRPKGSRNKRTEIRLRDIRESGQLPMDYLLEVMRDESNEQNIRVDAAKACMPYVHSKMPQVQINAETSVDTAVEMTDAEILEYIQAGGSTRAAKPESGKKKPSGVH